MGQCHMQLNDAEPPLYKRLILYVFNSCETLPRTPAGSQPTRLPSPVSQAQKQGGYTIGGVPYMNIYGTHPAAGQQHNSQLL